MAVACSRKQPIVTVTTALLWGSRNISRLLGFEKLDDQPDPIYVHYECEQDCNVG